MGVSPAPWGGDPACGHRVSAAYQTHYCSYIRVPRLLALQPAGAGDQLLLATAYQWYELWFKVLLADLRAALTGPADSYAPVVLLRRGLELFQLFDQHADLGESALVRELGLTQPVADPLRRPPSDQFQQLVALQPGLARLAAAGFPGLAEAVAAYSARFAAFARRYRRFARSTLVSDPAAPAFAAWLYLPDLLDLQQGVKSAWTVEGVVPQGHWQPPVISPDELMFVVVHQCFEVWFRALLDHLDRAVAALAADDVATATALVSRVVAIQRLLVPQIQIPATMLPLDFMRFRDQRRTDAAGVTTWTGLTPASGTESYQFREIEIVCGLRDDPTFQTFLAGSDQLPIRLLTPRQQQRLAAPTLPEVFLAAVQRRGLTQLEQLFTPAATPNPHLDLAVLADRLLDFDQFFRLWRVGHHSMVARMIGGRSGTGFLGPEYLAETTGAHPSIANRIFAEHQARPRFFEALWAVRDHLTAPSANP